MFKISSLFGKSNPTDVKNILGNTDTLEWLASCSDDVILRYSTQTGTFDFVSANAEIAFNKPLDLWFQQADFFKSLLSPSSAQTYETYLQSSLHELPITSVELQLNIENDGWQWVQFSVIHESSTSETIVFRLKDISETKQLTQSLEIATARFDAICDKGKDWYWEANIEGDFTFVSDGVTQILGYTPEEMVGRNFSEFLAEEDLEHISEFFEDLIETKASYSNVLNKNIHKDGHVVILESSGTPILNEAGEMIGLRGADNDITELVQSSEALRRHKTELEKILEERTASLHRAEALAHVGSWLLDMKTSTYTLSKEAHVIFGIELGKTTTLQEFISAIHQDDLDRVVEAWSVAHNGDDYNIEHRVVTPEGVKWVHIHAYFDLDENGEAIAVHGSVQDISDRKAVEQQLIEGRHAAEHLAQAKTNFLANMSHEIRTPMGAIIGMSELLLKTSLETSQRSRVEKIHQAGTNLLSILNDILDFSKIEAGQLNFEETAFSINSVIQNLRNILSFKIEEKNLSLVIDVDSNIPQRLLGDPSRIAQVLINLGNNAVKFTESGGSISVGVVIAEQVSSDQVSLKFEIKDNGIGISPKQQQQLFHPFQQADVSTTRKYGGSGLGLTISKQLVEKMGGYIWFKSELNKGSTFYFTVKLKVATDKSSSLNGTNGAQHITSEVLDIEPLNGSRILVVEDNEINQELVEDILVDYGANLTIVNNGKEALYVLSEQSFDVVLMDCQMPVMDGYEATQKLRAQQQFEHLPIIAMTASVLKGDVDKMMSTGMNAHIAKPFDIDHMIKTLLKWL